MQPHLIIPQQQQHEARAIMGSKFPSALTITTFVGENSNKLPLLAALLAGAISLLV